MATMALDPTTIPPVQSQRVRINLLHPSVSMGSNGQEILEAALALSELERVRIAEALLASLGPQEKAMSDAEFRDELDRRVDDYLKGQDEGIDWEDLRDEM